jgi:hypothetical protein
MLHFVFNYIHEDLILLTSPYNGKISRTLYITDFNDYNILDNFFELFLSYKIGNSLIKLKVFQ